MSWKKIFKLCLAVIICTIGFSGTALAQDKTHIVKAGETLFSIAKQHNVTVQNLREWNNLQADQLSVGQSLIIEPEATEEPVVHTVQPQETLFSISKTYGVNISELKTWNNLSGNTLQPGQKLNIHRSNTDEAAGNPETENSIAVDVSADNNTYYTVKSGDTLYKIARDHNMSLEELKQLNDLKSNTLSIGQQLTVKATSAPPSVAESVTESSPQGKFVTYRAERAQALDQLLEQFKMTKTEFKALNPEFSSDEVQKGQRVTVLAPPSRAFANPYLMDSKLEGLGETTVSRYSSSERGKTTTSGELYNPKSLTAAHSNIAMGTVMFIQNAENNKGIYVRINDRLSGSGLKLSNAAWQALDLSSASPTVKIFQEQ